VSDTEDMGADLKRKPRTTAWLLAKYGNGFLGHLMELSDKVWCVVAWGGRCHYYIPPQREGKRWRTFFNEMGHRGEELV